MHPFQEGNVIAQAPGDGDRGITGYLSVLTAGYGSFDFGLPYSVTGDRESGVASAIVVEIWW